MFEHGVVAVDLAEDWAVLKTRLLRLQRLGTRRLTLVHVVSPGFPVAAERAHRHEQQQKLHAAEEEVRALGFEVESRLLVGELALQLDSAMEEAGAGYLVAGARAHGPIRELVMGNAVLDLARNAARAVWLEPLSAEQVTTGGGGVLLATDGSEAAQAAESIAGELIKAFGNGVAVWVKPKQWLPGESVTEPSDLHTHLQELSARHPPLRHQVSEGDPAREIQRIAMQQSSDVIVLGKRGRNPVTSLLMGRTAERICRHAPTAILLVPGQASG
ncbi:nucleotide-binding universal stress UspA family protein [Natronocella acetinitrilica]|uniref:Nucleotide-binding universal stress UspA family protein n=1 Tax=Natronocella acetinitrilica TaxID=414046 RepID=A0AAE3KCN5_9GAMM|nr:universal stress protein [Natronocella acetinitrilica]MCP1675966.1 nucleotide-binding universal stress UspA family protein [Natronocella acetinitrilica]